MKKILLAIGILLAALPMPAQVRIVHKGEMTGRFITAHPGKSAAEKEALDLAAHFLIADAPTKIQEWSMAVRKGDIVLSEIPTEEFG